MGDGTIRARAAVRFARRLRAGRLLTLLSADQRFFSWSTRSPTEMHIHATRRTAITSYPPFVPVRTLPLSLASCRSYPWPRRNSPAHLDATHSLLAHWISHLAALLCVAQLNELCYNVPVPDEPRRVTSMSPEQHTPTYVPTVPTRTDYAEDDTSTTLDFQVGDYARVRFNTQFGSTVRLWTRLISADAHCLEGRLIETASSPMLLLEIGSLVQFGHDDVVDFQRSM